MAPQAAASTEPMKEKTPRVDWAELLKRTFALDVFACARCGGRRKVLAYVTAPAGVRSILEHLGLPTQALKWAPARGPPQQAWC
ncbi:ATP-dependent helicase HrpA [Cystobacter fuscus]|uniref:ATP-dependent helicase HrpA n=1 Tax=Cystobacter fuscus TaxID=43 RepID=A0A250JCW9_9BACT|nr:ATP-dependent helicase HrpA [Cystobacter fuscus]ATB41749.1 ATP-dependent helicase HrpA [Cystobacter fuscus]